MRIFFLLLMLLGPVAAQDSPSRRPLPNPLLFGQNDSVSIIVVRASPDKAGLRQLFKTALAGSSGEGNGANVGSVMSGVISQKSQQSLVMLALPLQWVRVDQQDKNGQLLSTTALTVSGWQGVQALVYDAMVNGKPCETRHHRGEDIFLRPGWKTPDELLVLTRTKGCFINCSTPELARRALDQLLDNPSPSLHGALWEAYTRLAKNRDIYGALLNKKGSMLKMLRWAGRGATERIRRKIGVERFDRVADTVTLVSWEAEIASDDQIDLELRFTTASPAQVQELSSVWQEAQAVLNTEGRLANFHTKTLPSGLAVNLSVTGFRVDVSRFLTTLRL